ncbi:MAG TPA: YqgE/AlgH family protein [Planctomycetota bacterium]|nr:YqgE/AlgH family protein [Planctomycetota bacterium]
MQPAAGMLLVASANLTEPSFMRAVVYLLEHDEDGTLGFIINRPLDIPLSELWSECPPGLITARIAAEGGPVEPNKGLLLHTCLDLPGVQAMGLGLAVGGDLDALAKRYLEGGDDSGPRLFLGHSGWAPGQLQAEIEEGAWIVRPGKPELVVNHKPSPMMWQHLLEGHGGLPEPSLN